LPKNLQIAMKKLQKEFKEWFEKNKNTEELMA
jgi:hypothetical protein